MMAEKKIKPKPQRAFWRMTDSRTAEPTGQEITPQVQNKPGGDGKHGAELGHSGLSVTVLFISLL